jgi:hypothetical protein
MEIHQVGAELCHVGGQMDRHDKVNSRSLKFCELVPSPKKVSNRQQLRVKLEFLYVEGCSIFLTWISFQPFVHISDTYFPPSFSHNSNSVSLPMFISYPTNTTVFQNGFNICTINFFKAFILVLYPVPNNPLPPLVVEVIFYALDPVKQ